MSNNSVESADDPMPPDMPTTPEPTDDNEAPFGLTAAGRPKKGPGGRPRKPSPGPAGGPPPRQRSSRARTDRRRTPAGPSYATAVAGLFQLPAGALAMAAGTVREPLRTTLLADSMTVETYAPPIAEALGDLAREDARVAAVLERVLTVGPYGAVIAATLPMLLQLGANHRVLPAGLFGTADLVSELDQQRPMPPAQPGPVG